MENQNFIEVSVLIQETDLEDLKSFVLAKGGRVTVQTAETGDIPICVEESSDENVDSAEVDVAAATNPKEIGENDTTWLRNNGISQKYFAAKVLNRSQGSFSDYVTKAPSEMPKTHGRAIWLRLHQFLQNEDEQEDLRKQIKKDSSLKRKAGGAEAPENSADDVDNQARKRFSDIEQSTLDTIYVTCAGKPDKATIESAANGLKIPEKQVTTWFNNHRRHQKNGTYKPGQYSNKTSVQNKPQ